MSNLPEDVIQIIFEYLGNWKKRNGKWMSLIHNDDTRIKILDDYIKLKEKNKNYFMYNNEYMIEYYTFPLNNKESPFEFICLNNIKSLNLKNIYKVDYLCKKEHIFMYRNGVDSFGSKRIFINITKMDIYALIIFLSFLYYFSIILKRIKFFGDQEKLNIQKNIVELNQYFLHRWDLLISNNNNNL